MGATHGGETVSVVKDFCKTRVDAALIVALMAVQQRRHAIATPLRARQLSRRRAIHPITSSATVAAARIASVISGT